jgi:Arc/MetJ family transcription regulator
MPDPAEGTMTDTAVKSVSESDVDEDLLAEAQRQIAAPSRSATINAALRLLVEQERTKRGEALEEARRMVRDGEVEFLPLDSVDQ